LPDLRDWWCLSLKPQLLRRSKTIIAPDGIGGLNMDDTMNSKGVQPPSGFEVKNETDISPRDWAKAQ